MVLAVACQPTGPSRVEVPADTAAGEVAFELAGATDAALVVPVTLNGRGPFDFVLDTGATLTCVDAALADSLALPERRGTLGVGAGIGSSGRMKIVSLDSVGIGAARAFDLAGCIVDLGQMNAVGLDVDGLLGLNFLKSFRVSIDFERNVLTLSPPGRRTPAGSGGEREPPGDP